MGRTAVASGLDDAMGNGLDDGTGKKAEGFLTMVYQRWGEGKSGDPSVRTAARKPSAAARASWAFTQLHNPGTSRVVQLTGMHLIIMAWFYQSWGEEKSGDPCVCNEEILPRARRALLRPPGDQPGLQRTGRGP